MLHPSRSAQVQVTVHYDSGDPSPDRLGAVLPRRQAGVLRFEDEEEWSGAIGPVSGVFDVRPAAVARPGRILAAFQRGRAIYPLRC